MTKFTVIIIFISIIVFAQELVSMSNGDVGIVVDKVTGQFAIGDVSGNPVINGYPNDPYNTHFCVKFNGIYYSNESGIGDGTFSLRDSAQQIENTISIQFNIGANRVWEKFYTLDEPDLSGFIYIEYVFYNDDPLDSAIIGFSEYMDILIGDNPAPTTVIPGEIIRRERKFVDSIMPAYWTFFSDYGDTDSFLGQGVPIGRDEIYADMVIFSNTDSIYDATWDYVALVDSIIDLATFMRWNTEIINPYGIYIVGHYYGLGYPNAEIDDVLKKLTPARYIIDSPYPNPTNGAAKIGIEVLDYPQNIIVDVFGISGRQVAHIYDGNLDVGKHSFNWNLKDSYGKDIQSGIYYFVISSGPSKNCRPVLVVK
ncbi:hypothetical protein J7L68_09120 [bacterium]|nr:hypothetical protein [bacterium]